MQPGSAEKHWLLRLEAVLARSYSLDVAWGIFLFLETQPHKSGTISLWQGGEYEAAIPPGFWNLYLKFALLFFKIK